MTLTPKQIKQIKKFALNYYKKLDPTHNINHANRTVSLAKHLAKKEKANIEISKFGALLHQFHPERAKKVEKLLAKIDVQEDIIKQLVHCVECTDRKTVHKAKTLEAKIVYDSDKLQVLGPFGFSRELAYRTVVHKMDFINAVRFIKKLQEDRFKHLQTKTAIKLAKKNQEKMRDFYNFFEKWVKVDVIKK